jgi:dynein heavy chain, axonemal
MQGTMQYSNGRTQKFGATMQDCPTRRFTKPKNQGKISAVLLGAGEDPMSKDQDFSHLAANCNALMHTSFQKPSGAMSRFPPVIDPFSRTLAAPVSSQRHYLSVCHKIGTNYTPTAKGFYIDTEMRIVRFKDISDDKSTKLEIFNENDIEPADEEEEY